MSRIQNLLTPLREAAVWTTFVLSSCLSDRIKSGVITVPAQRVCCCAHDHRRLAYITLSVDKREDGDLDYSEDEASDSDEEDDHFSYDLSVEDELEDEDEDGMEVTR